MVGLLDCPEYKQTIIPYKERKEILEAIPEIDDIVRQTSLEMDLDGVDVVFSGDGFEKEEMECIKKAGAKAVNIGYYKPQSTTKIKEKIWSFRFTQ